VHECMPFRASIPARRSSTSCRRASCHASIYSLVHRIFTLFAPLPLHVFSSVLTTLILYPSNYSYVVQSFVARLLVPPSCYVISPCIISAVTTAIATSPLDVCNKTGLRYIAQSY
jgi:hypothetical protein